MKSKTRIYVIPALMEVSPGEYAPFEKYPNALVFGDTALAESLGTTRDTIYRWCKKGLIPFTKKRGYNEFRLLDVVNALRSAGYSQDVEGNPTGVSQSQYTHENK